MLLFVSLVAFAMGDPIIGFVLFLIWTMGEVQ
jgi:hypothetical protein